MLLKLDGKITVEDLLNHTPESVEELQGLLARGVSASADPHRKDFYEIEHDFRVFYIHICPNKKVLLLAMWPKGCVQAHLQPASRVAASPAI